MPAPDSTRAAQVTSYYESFLAADGPAIANGWRTFAADHPELDAGTAAQQYADQLLAEGIGTAVGSAVTGTGDALGQVTAGTAAGAENVAKSGKGLGTLLSSVDALPKFLSMLTSGNLWMRVGEVLAGLILLGIGVNALFKGKPLATVTNVAGKAAPLAMAG